MTKSKHLNKEHSLIIDRLGGTGAVARIFDVSDPTVSIWRKTKIPKARMMYIKLAYPSVIETECSPPTNSLKPQEKGERSE